MSFALPTDHKSFDVRQTTRSSSASDLTQGAEQALFSREELTQFEADDVQIMSRIGKILSALFVYTIIAMSVAIWWTLRTV